MIKINVRQFLHRFSYYKEKVKNGERIVVMERHQPLLDVTPHKEHLGGPGWKRDHFRLKLDGASLSQTCVELRNENPS